MSRVSLPGLRERFERGVGFALDAFQLQALDALDGGQSVLVAAPTGSGKTVVAEYAVARALAEGAKAFYTTPLKALSNQKYGDFVRRYGSREVGLLTGDNSINGEAPIVVMTTEVLRNMIYAGSRTLTGLRYVVLDEVHYLENAWRGPVWEEVIIHTPPEVDLVCLSATVSNAEQFSEWIAAVRGPTAAIIEERRPVELHHLYLLGDRDAERLVLLPTFVDGRPNPAASQMDSRLAREGPSGWRGRRRQRSFTPRPAEVVAELGEHGMLPAISFIFSRAGCDEAVRACLDAGIRLTTAAERAQIHAIARGKADALADADLAVLGYDEWVTALQAGVAAHHAGMVPPFKEAVETCFAAGLVKVVFATETLALGINMPARSVVIERLTKFTGERHEFLRPGEYTQLTGRAGRRGIDTLGYAVVLWSPFVPFDQVAGLASKRSDALVSAFRPTYNMAANLVQRYPPARAHHLLNLSFAQFCADGDVVRLETEMERARATAAKARREAFCELGDLEEYRQLSRAAREGSTRQASARAEVEAALGRIKPGDVLLVPGRVAGERVAVVSVAHRRGGEVRLGTVTVDTARVMLVARDFPVPPEVVARLELPVPYQPRGRRFLADTARALRALRLRPAAPRATARPPTPVAVATELDDHPCAACPDLRAHERAATRADRAEAEAERIEGAIRRRAESLARQLDRVLRILGAWGYVDGWSLTGTGRVLARLYHECDLLVAEAIGTGLLEGVSPPELAALVSTFTYEARGPIGAGPPPGFPTRLVRERWQAIEALAGELNRAETEAGLPTTRLPDPGFAGLAWAWASGQDLGEVLEGAPLSGGDFVRNIRQLLDLMRQLGELAPGMSTRETARATQHALMRGVVAASSAIDVG